jgi:hypothetical protein
MNTQKFKRHRFFHFTTKFVNPNWYEANPNENWFNILKSLQNIQNNRATEDIVWHSGVLMSNHIHLLFSIQGYNEHSLILDFEQSLLNETGLAGKLFQRPLPCEPIYHLEQLKAAYKFIYRSPVSEGLVRNVEDYTYSSLYILLNRDRMNRLNPFHDPLQIIQNLPVQLRWLNSKPSFESDSLEIYRDKSLGF